MQKSSVKEISSGIVNDIKTENFSPLYLLFGSERYLVKKFESDIKKAIIPDDDYNSNMMNYSLFNGKEAVYDTVMEEANSVPVFGERKLVVVRDSGLFAAGRKDESEKFTAYFPDIPDTTTIVFVESDVDKRLSIYKKADKTGRAVEFNLPSEAELLDWVIKLSKRDKKILSSSVASYFLKSVSPDMLTIRNELIKLLAYTGSSTEITVKDIDMACTKSFEARIFDLVAAIGNKKAGNALEMLANMIIQKESPIMVLVMIARQFRLLVQCRYLSDSGMGTSEISKTLGIQSFIARDIHYQSKNFDLKILIQAFKDCLETDISIKTGKLTDRLGVELLILKYGSKNPN